MAHWMLETQRLVVFTVAGISTESRLPDFRGPDGLRTRQAKGLPPLSRDLSSGKPNAGHMGIVELQRLGKLGFLISQNVDNLHPMSGIRQDSLVELHGNITRLRCRDCEFVLDNVDDEITCPLCGGKLVSSVVNFGQSLPRKELADSYAHSRSCDLFLVAGSSLVVYPAAGMPGVAVEAGARLVIINQGETPFDRVAQLRFGEAVGKVLPQAVNQLKKLMKPQ